MSRITIADTILDAKALEWFMSLSPGIRAVYIQALWECEGQPGLETELPQTDITEGEETCERLGL